ncbi:hypothetical protein D3C71_2155460 [compost metagenome]
MLVRHALGEQVIQSHGVQIDPGKLAVHGRLHQVAGGGDVCTDQYQSIAQQFGDQRTVLWLADFQVAGR